MAEKPTNKNADATDFDPEVLDESTQAVVTAAPVSLGCYEGDNDPSTMKLPRLQIAYGVGKLSENFNPGDLVLDETDCLVSKGEPLNIIILSAKEYYKEYLRYDPANPTMPRIFSTKAEVQAAGGTTEWVNGVGPSFSPALHLNILIEKPEDLVSGLFTRLASREDAPEYAAACWDVDKTAFRKIGPRIKMFARMSLRERGLHSAVFQVKTSSTTAKSGNKTVAPSIDIVRHLSDEEIREITSLFGG